MHTSALKFTLAATAVLSALTLPVGNAQANEHRVVNGVNKSGQPLLLIDDIVCEGNENTDCDFITKKYYQQKGDVLDPDEVADARLRLGTLIQFRNIDIRLEKGHKRGHVIVVFDVQEASNVQYEWNTSFRYSKDSVDACLLTAATNQSLLEICLDEKRRNQHTDLGGTITDFNFLGSGKRLSFGVSGQVGKSHSDAEHIISDSAGNIDHIMHTSEGDGHSYGLSLDYYDPHLMGSSHYYWRARVAHYRSDTEGESSQSFNGQLSDFSHAQQDSFSTPYTVELGKRFGSHSFVAFNIDKVHSKTGSDSRTYTTYGLNYGWDARDDVIFATKGSVFNSRLSHIEDTNSLSVNYADNIALGHNKIFTWSLDGQISRYKVLRSINPIREDDQTSVTYGASVRYTQIKEIDDFEGIYSGWYGELSLGKTNHTPEGFPDLNINLNAGYTYQTSSMIYRFTLGLSTMGTL